MASPSADLGRRDSLLAERRELRDRIAALDGELAHHDAPQRPVRERLLDALLEIGCMAHSRQLALYVECLHGHRLASTRFSSISRDEERAARRGYTRALWLCHALVFDRGSPMRGLWARSDWPLHERIMAPLSGRVLHLRLTAGLARLAIEHEADAADALGLKHLAANAAGGMGTAVAHGEFHLGAWRDTALAQLARVEGEDLAARREAAARLSAEFAATGFPSALFGSTDSTVP